MIGVGIDVAKAKSLHANALECIPTLPSKSPSTKMLVLEAAKAVSNADKPLQLF